MSQADSKVDIARPRLAYAFVCPYTRTYSEGRSTVTIAASARFEFRLRPEAKSRIERAAELVHESTSDFARTAAEERADRVLQEHMLATIVPAEFFDQLL